MNNVKISSKIFSSGLTAKEIAVYAYLCSIPGQYKKVRQATIGKCFGIKTNAAVAAILSSLKKKGLITEVITTQRSDNRIGSNIYVVKELSFNEGFFFYPRKLLHMGLNYKLTLVLLYQYRAYSPKFGFSWNSYNDMVKVLGFKRSALIGMIKQLTESKLLYKKRMLRPASANLTRRVFVDNRYVVVWFETGCIKKKTKKVDPPTQLGKPTTFRMKNRKNFIQRHIQYIAKGGICQWGEQQFSLNYHNNDCVSCEPLIAGLDTRLIGKYRTKNNRQKAKDKALIGLIKLIKDDINADS